MLACWFFNVPASLNAEGGDCNFQRSRVLNLRIDDFIIAHRETIGRRIAYAFVRSRRRSVLGRVFSGGVPAQSAPTWAHRPDDSRVGTRSQGAQTKLSGN